MNQFDWKRFQAPAAIQRVYDFVKSNTDILMDNTVEDYLHNGLYLLHCMFSFESCMQYLTGWQDAKRFIKQYMEEYSEIEKELKRIVKEMQVKSTVFSKLRTELFCISRKMYVYYYVVKAGK